MTIVNLYKRKDGLSSPFQTGSGVRMDAMYDDGKKAAENRGW